jgi:hypothetical protein
MKPDFKDGDIVIRRVLNGWIVYSGSDYDDNHVVTTVHEQGPGEWDAQETLISLIREYFSDQVQQKTHGGIKFEVRVKGYADE